MTWLVAYNAVVRREILVYLRRKQIFFAVLLLSFILTWSILMSWPAESQNWFMARSLSNTVLVMTQIVLLFSALALTPAIASGMISGERERNTWELCIASPMPISALVAGKWTASVALVATLLLALGPFVSTVFFLIGVDIIQVVYCGAVILASAIVAALGAIAVSVSTRKSAAATVFSYIFILFFVGGYPALIGILVEFDIVDSNSWVLRYVFATSPVWLLVSILTGGLTREAPVTFAASMALYGGIFWLYILHRLRHTADATPIPEPVYKASFWKFSLRRSGRWRKPQAPIADGKDPVFVRERLWGMPLSPNGDRTTFFYALFGSVGFASVVIVTFGSVSSAASDIVAFVGGFLAVGAAFLQPTLLAGLFPRELERNTAVCLSTTLLTSREIALGKCRAGRRRAFAIAAAFATTLTSVWLLYRFQPSATVAFGYSMGIVVSGTAVAYALATIASLRCKTSAGAVLTGFLLLGLASFGGPMLVYMLFGMFADVSGAITPEDLALICTLISPAVNFIAAMDQHYNELTESYFVIAACQVAAAFAWLTFEIRRFKYRFDTSKA